MDQQGTIAAVMARLDSQERRIAALEPALADIIALRTALTEILATLERIAGLAATEG